jgi:cysteine-rich repeat protein
MKRLLSLSSIVASLSGCFFVLGFQKGLVCGDGILTEARGEECDDGNTDPANGFEQFNDTCSAECTTPKCGDGIQDPFATQDQNGDGVINFADSPEQCDDGNDDDTDECNSSCRRTLCGDGVQQTVPTIDTDLDGIADATEACDDGSACQDGTSCDPTDPNPCADFSGCQPRGGDGCAQDCRKLEVCGDGFVDAGEECDDGNNIDADGCEADCTDPACANGILDPGEVCFEGDFLQPTVGSGVVPSYVLADLDGDTNLDVVLATAGDVQIFFGDGDGTFEATAVTLSDPENLNLVAVGDFDGDQLLDVVSLDTNPTNGAAILFAKNNGNRSFGAFVRDAQTLNNNFVLAVGDLNGDAFDDIIDTSRFATDRFFLGDGDGTFTQTDYTFTPTDPGLLDRVSLGDLDGDQDLDIVFSDDGASNMLVSINNAPAPTFTTTLLTGGNNAATVALADFNGDGLVDIASLGSFDLRLRLNQGNATFGAPTQPLSTFLDQMNATDFDLDGTSELLLRQGNSSNTDAFVFDGAALIQTVFSPFSGGVVQSPRFADINKDGVQDMLFTQSNVIGGLYLFLGAP